MQGIDVDIITDEEIIERINSVEQLSKDVYEQFLQCAWDGIAEQGESFLTQIQEQF